MNLPELPAGFGFRIRTSETSTTVIFLSGLHTKTPYPIEETTFKHQAILPKEDWLRQVENAKSFLWLRYQGKRERQQWIQELNNGC